MPVTVRGTDILFNDGSTQASAPPLTASPVAGNISESINSGGHNASVANTWQLSKGRALVTKAGTVRIRLDYAATTVPDGYGGTFFEQASYRIYVNGVAVGTQYNAPVNNSAYFTGTQDITVAANDIIQLGAFSPYSGRSFRGGFQVGVAALNQIPAIFLATVF